MAKTRWVVVDLGTKKGGAIDVYRKAGHRLYRFPQTKPKMCLGIDKKAKYKDVVARKGYTFNVADILDPEFVWPAAQVYLAFDFLEHLPSIATAQEVLRKMIKSCEVGVWLRCPSFEPEPRLKKAGVRFAWTDWRGHKADFKIDDAMQVIKDCETKLGCKLKTKVVANQKFKHTHNDCFVPLNAPTDTVKYKEKLGPKKKVMLTPPVPGQHEILIWKPVNYISSNVED